MDNFNDFYGILELMAAKEPDNDDEYFDDQEIFFFQDTQPQIIICDDYYC